MAALAKQEFGLRLLEIARANLGRWYVGRDRQHRHATAMAVEEAVDQVQISGTAGSCTNRELTGEVRFGTGREGPCLFIAHMHPTNPALPAQRISDAIEAVAHHAVYALNARDCERLGNLVCNCLAHDCFLPSGTMHSQPIPQQWFDSRNGFAAVNWFAYTGLCYGCMAH